MSAVGVALIGVSARAGQGSGAGQSVSWVAVAYSGLGVLGVLGRGGWCIGVSVYCRTPAPIAPRASLDRCIGVLPQSGADRSQCPLDRCIGVSVYYRNPAPFAPNAPWIGVSVYRCITAVRRRSLPGPPWVGVSVYRCMGRGDRCIGVSVYFNLPAPSCGRTATLKPRRRQSKRNSRWYWARTKKHDSLLSHGELMTDSRHSSDPN